MEVLTIIDKILALRPVRWVLLFLFLLCLAAVIFLRIQRVALTASLKSAKADATETRGILMLQNEAIKQAGEATARLRKQAETKAQEAEQARGVARANAEEIMRLKLSKDCKEVARWGVQQGNLQGRW